MSKTTTIPTRRATSVRGALGCITALGGYPVTVKAAGAAGRPTYVRDNSAVKDTIQVLLSRSPESAVIVRTGA